MEKFVLHPLSLSPVPGVTEICASPPPLLPETPQCVGGVGNIPFTSVTNVSMIKSAPADIPDPPKCHGIFRNHPRDIPDLENFAPLPWDIPECV